MMKLRVDRVLRAALGVAQQQYADAPDDIATLTNFARHAATDLFNMKHPSFADEREVRIARMLVRAEEGSLSDVGGSRTTAARSDRSRNGPERW